MFKNLWGSPLKDFGAKDIQNLGRFWTTSDFDREYLRNEIRYQISERYVTENYSFRVQRIMYGES